MDIFMTNISYNVTEHQLKRDLARVLHDDEFQRSQPSAQPVNFQVTIMKHVKAHATTRHGYLTLGSEPVARQFLLIYGGSQPSKRFSVRNKAITFAISRKGARPGTIEALRRMPYLDPQAAEARERIAEEYSHKIVNFDMVQFGWECRDLEGVFSAEYEFPCDGCGTVQFNDDTRQIRIRVVHPEPYLTQDTKVIVVAFNQIRSLAIGTPGLDPCIFLALHHPPMYETEETPLLADARRERGQPPCPRRRYSAFDNAHAQTAMYTSHAIRLVCSDNDDEFVTFRDLCITAGLQSHMVSRAPQIERRQLFSPLIQQEFIAWISRLDWSVAFQVEALTGQVLLNLAEILALRENIDALCHMYGPTFTSGLLRYFGTETKSMVTLDEESDEETVRHCFARCVDDFIKNPPKPTRVSRNTDDLFECYHIQVTPTRYILQGPFPERLNRVIRKYITHAQCFIRVSFVDENLLLYRGEREVDGRQFIHQRFGRALWDIVVGGEQIEFLAYSQSALKEHSVWFVRPFFDESLGGHINAEKIINDLGRFHNLSYDEKMGRCPARYAARISQSFTATEFAVHVDSEEVIFVKDIERRSANGKISCFTDGVGTISPDLARSINEALYKKTQRRRKPLVQPTAFQIRFMGAKGMLSVDHKMRGKQICIRNSMVKFDVPPAELEPIEIAQAFDRPSRYYLNRPLIMLLEGLGVPYEVFEKFQAAAVLQAKNATHDLYKIALLLEGHGLGASFRIPSVLRHLHRLNIRTIPGQFYQRMQEFAVHHVLREIKHKARIPVPGGWILVGVADVHNYLRPNEIFACLRCPDCRRDIYVEGPTLVSRSPTIHPGDVQVLSAIGRPPSMSPFAYQPLKNTIVFSTQGERSIPSYLGGGDLDGDTYNVWSTSCVCKCTGDWNLEEVSLRPRVDNYIPAEYEPAEKSLTDDPCTMEDVQRFFIDYISSDVLGLVATNWLLIADISEDGIFDDACFKLAQLHSDAVDYPKSGNPVDMADIPRPDVRVKPDWHAPETISDLAGKYYTSERAIGKLARAVKLPALAIVQNMRQQREESLRDSNQRSITELTVALNVDGTKASHFSNIPRLIKQHIRAELPEIILPPVEEHEVKDAWDLLQSFSNQTHHVCSSYTLFQAKEAMLMEQEILIGTIVAKSSQPRKRHDLMAKMRDITTVHVRDARDELKGDEQSTSEDWLRRSYTAWRLSMLAVEDQVFGAHSFWWVTLGAVFDAVGAIKDNEEENDYV